MIKRLPWIVTFLLLAASTFAEAPQTGKVSRIGFLIPVSLSTLSARVEAFRQGLRELGYVEGKNIVIEWRSAEGKADRLPALAAELVRLKVDVIVTVGPPATRPAKQATVTIPIGRPDLRVPSCYHDDIDLETHQLGAHHNDGHRLDRIHG